MDPRFFDLLNFIAVDFLARFDAAVAAFNAPLLLIEPDALDAKEPK